MSAFQKTINLGTEILLNIINNYIPIPAFLAILAIVLLLIIRSVYRRKKKKKKKVEMKLYIEKFTNYFNTTGQDIKETLIKVNESFREEEKIHIVIDKALFYLDHSIERDYDTAFKIIEKYFNHIDVSDLHRTSLAIVKTAVYRESQNNKKEDFKGSEKN